MIPAETPRPTAPPAAMSPIPRVLIRDTLLVVAVVMLAALPAAWGWTRLVLMLAIVVAPLIRIGRIDLS